MQKWLWLGLALAGLVGLTACSVSSREQATHTPTVGAQATAPGAASARRDAPLPIDSGFFNDEAALVGNTGRPQFVEFYTEW